MRQFTFATLAVVMLTAGCKEASSSKSPKEKPSAAPAKPGEVVLNVPGMH